MKVKLEFEKDAKWGLTHDYKVFLRRAFRKALQYTAVNRSEFENIPVVIGTLDFTVKRSRRSTYVLIKMRDEFNNPLKDLKLPGWTEYENSK